MAERKVIDHDELRRLAENAPKEPWAAEVPNVFLCGRSREALNAYIAALSPDVVLGLLDEIERLKEIAWKYENLG